MGFLSGIFSGVTKGYQDNANKLTDIRTAGDKAMAELYTKLGDSHPALAGEYYRRAKVHMDAASDPFNPAHQAAKKSFGDPGEPIRDLHNKLINDAHVSHTGAPAPKEILIPGKPSAASALGLSSQPQATPQAAPAGPNWSQGEQGPQQLPPAPEPQQPQMSGPPTEMPSLSSKTPVSGALSAQSMAPPPTPQPTMSTTPPEFGVGPAGTYYQPFERKLWEDAQLENQKAKIASQFHQPITVKKHDTVIDNTGKVIYQGDNSYDPSEQSAAEQVLNVAASLIATKHGIPINKNKSPLEQLPPALAGEAITLSKDIGESSDTKILRQLGIQNKQSIDMMRNLQMSLIKNALASGQDSTDTVLFNPTYLQDAKLDKNAKALLINQLRSKGYPVPTQVPTPMVQQEEFVHNTLEHARQIKAMVTKYPTLVGPAIGRLSGIDQKTGLPIFTDFAFPEGDPRRDLEQQLRTQLAYFFTNEVKSAIPGRPPIQFMDNLKAVSAQPSMAPALFLNALEGMVNSAKTVQHGINAKRYGTPYIIPPPDVMEKFAKAANNDPDEMEEMVLRAGFLVPGTR